ncbi:MULTISPECIES: response regulator [Okeania]|uniref:histidine kinase n=1 Tax=Okeania hirsuta TaxID=1458930 RepID=A0A3N6PCQ8_9CYAN|nr:MULTISPECIES: response regulator [Okeania]NET12599.1 hybrid sensor histidine kinase/response regulator [Okeania sp. SIO1H6]NES79279.1 hybrid sensor histidine kinase/response regulator [Okeania sp. SIO1H4]NES91952.1 hybrid sensor histidine kinase/response regulator [Okeania sp. SIO2B9]NET22998.1 hybrid sensor histidine kinase/response regulator [Okeania sp. SIO1H5]NET78285.1 hybrid sensor histidine kinase/response regulator [Okeania sp. SIO1F9]
MKKILVIEDEKVILEIITDVLEAENFIAIEAENGRRGVEKALEIVPDLIICDVMMPELDGYEVLKLLRKNLVTETIPFIFLTAKSTKADLREAMELGADDYLTKPFTRDELMKAINTRLEKQGTIQRKTQEQLDELRSSITLSLPHELRTPLNGIIGSANFIIEEFQELENDEILEMVENIHISAHRLYRLIQNFLLYADLELLSRERDRLKLFTTGSVSNPKSIIREVALEKARSFNRLKDLEIASENTHLKISEPNFRKIVDELLDNAFKFSDFGTKVKVVGRLVHHVFAVDFIDFGKGMSVNEISNIGAYKQFNRKIYEQQGSGLGLSIAKQITELHNGQLKIQSIPLEQTTVTVFIPTKVTEKGC